MPHPGIVICGATGSNKNAVNGVYLRTTETKNERPVYSRIGAAHRTIYYCHTKAWYVTSADSKDKGKASGFAYTPTDGLSSPVLESKSWMIWSGDEWLAQADVTVDIDNTPTSFFITRASGENAHRINGVYTKSMDGKNRKPVYRKIGNDKVCCFYASDRKWRVAATSTRDEDETVGYAETTSTKLDDPTKEGKTWRAHVSNGGGWAAQKNITLKIDESPPWFHITGVTGPSTEAVGGVYTKSGEVCNRRPVYEKVGDDTKCCFYTTERRWSVSTMATKDANGTAGFAQTTTVGLGAPDQEASKKWRIFDNGTNNMTSGSLTVGTNLVPGFINMGAHGTNQGYVNGVFIKTDEMKNNRPVYKKVGDDDRVCFYGTDRTWNVSNKTTKDANKTSAFLSAKTKNLDAPWLETKRCQVWMGDEWKDQHMSTDILINTDNQNELHKALKAAPDAPTSNWKKRWHSGRKEIVYYSIETDYVLGSDSMAFWCNHIRLKDCVSVSGRGDLVRISEDSVHSFAEAYQKRRADTFTFTGATGSNAKTVNGTFVKTEEIVNDKPVYAKVGNKDRCCYYTTADKWYVTSIKSKNANKVSGFAYTPTPGLGVPHLEEGTWQIWSGEEWKDQEAVKCQPAAPDDSPFGNAKSKSQTERTKLLHALASDCTGYRYPMSVDELRSISLPYFTEDALSPSKFAPVGNRTFLPILKALFGSDADHDNDGDAFVELSLREFFYRQIRRFVAMQVKLSRDITDNSLKKLMEITESRYRNAFRESLKLVYQEPGARPYLEIAGKLCSSINDRNPEPPRQSESTLTAIKELGVENRAKYIRLMSALASASNGQFLEASDKSEVRILEKIAMRPPADSSRTDDEAVLEDIGQADCSSVCDCTRGALKYNNTAEMAYATQMLMACDANERENSALDMTLLGLGEDASDHEIRFVRGKDRFASPGSSFYADGFYNFYFVNDPKKYVMEIQLMHHSLYGIRANTAHRDYGKHRSAREFAECTGRVKLCPVAEKIWNPLDEPASGQGSQSGVPAAEVQSLRTTASAQADQIRVQAERITELETLVEQQNKQLTVHDRHIQELRSFCKSFQSAVSPQAGSRNNENDEDVVEAGADAGAFRGFPTDFDFGGFDAP